MNLKHGMKHTPEYMAWNMMIQRCENPNHKAYKMYGGRGIRVCQRWRVSFENFFADVGQRPTPGHSIDRFPDKNGDYCPSNVRWATRIQQQNNMRGNKIVTYKGQECSFADAWRMAGSVVRYDTARQRMDAGWDIQSAVETPLDVRFSRLKKFSPSPEPH